MKRFRSILIGFLWGVAGFAVAQTVPYFTIWDPSQAIYSINTLLTTMNSQIFSYITFAKAGSVGELSFLAPVQVSGTSILVVMPSGSGRYIQTSATP